MDPSVIGNYWKTGRQIKLLEKIENRKQGMVRRSANNINKTNTKYKNQETTGITTRITTTDSKAC